MDSDYQYHVHGDYNSDGQYQEDGDHYDDTDGHCDNRNTWHDDGEGYPDEECGMFEEHQGQTATTTFFDGASNFVIDGGSFFSTPGDCSADFEWGSEPPRPPPPPSPSRSNFFKGTSNFVISGDRSDAPEGVSPIPPQPNAKKRAQGSRTLQKSTEMKRPDNHKRSSNRGFPDSRSQRSDNKPMDAGRYQSQKSSSRLSGNYYSNGKDSVPNLQAPRSSPSRGVTTFYKGATNMRQINPSFLSVGGHVYGSLPPTFPPNPLVQEDDSPQDERNFTSDYHGRAYRPYSDGLVQENVSHVIIGGKYYPDGINSVPNSQAPQNPPQRRNISFYEGTSSLAPTFPEPEIQVMPTPIPSTVGFPTPDHQTTHDMPAPVQFPQAVPSPASSRFLTKRQGNLKNQDHGVIRHRNRLTTSESPRSEQRNTKATLDTKLRSTTAKLAELTLNGFRKRSSQTADRRVRLNDQVSMPHPRAAAHTSADWGSPSPSHLSRSSDDDDMYVKELHKPGTQSPLACVSQGKRVLGPQPPQIAMPQPATVRDPVLFPKPQQG